jgi:Zn-dependent protease
MQPDNILLIFYVIVLIYSIILHEIAHGWAAYIFGDKTAFYNNRLTLNPIPHIDPIGSVLLPAMLILSSSPMFLGWAKPVPVAEHNLVPYNLGKFSVSIAGIAVNISLAVIFTIVGSQLVDTNLKQLAFIVALVNSGLAIFNLIPFPPADGYRIIENFLPLSLQRQIDTLLQQYFLFTIIGAILLASLIFRMIFPPIYSLIYSSIF